MEAIAAAAPLPCPAFNPLSLPRPVTEIVPLAQITAANKGGVISIGNFDGVHRGHAALLSEARRLADEVSGPVTAMILDPHPAAILRPQQLPARLSWIERRAERMSEFGVDYLVVCETTREFLQQSAEAFFNGLVVEGLEAKAVVEGPNFFFGRGREGNVETLAELCDRNQIKLSIVEPTVVGDGMISSTRIRGLLAEGDVESAASLINAPHRIRGVVETGAGRGRTIGFPTANLGQVDVVTPALGVYGGHAYCQGKRHLAAIHIGPSPTFEQDGRSKIEVHLMDLDADLYGQTIMVDFAVRVRDIARFESAEDLAQQLATDVATIRSRLSSDSEFVSA